MVYLGLVLAIFLRWLRLTGIQIGLHTLGEFGLDAVSIANRTETANDCDGNILRCCQCFECRQCCSESIVKFRVFHDSSDTLQSMVDRNGGFQ